MKCSSCGIDIPPQFVKIIEKNSCPNCDGEIVTQSVREFMNELKEALSKMPNDPEGLAGWLLTNYRMEKIGSAEPVEFYRGKKSKDEDFEVRKNKKPLTKLRKMYAEAFNQQADGSGDTEVEMENSSEIDPEEEIIPIQSNPDMSGVGSGVIPSNKIPAKVRQQIKANKARQQQEEDNQPNVPLAPIELAELAAQINDIEIEIPEPVVSSKLQRYLGKNR